MALLHINDFLSKVFEIQQKGLLSSDLSNTIKVVLCNEACDLDSVVCTLVYSFLLQSLDKNMEFGPVIPLLNIKKEEFTLRTEVLYWLKKHSIVEDYLLFRESYDLKDLADSGKLHLYMVDHNVLSPSDIFLDPYVVSILDHHQLERTDTPVFGMLVEPVGSCCTLLTEQILEKNPELLDETIALLLYGTILLDTINLNELARRVTPKDVSMVEYLESYLKRETSKRIEVFDELTLAKTNISELSTIQVLHKDMKTVSANNLNIALSSVPLLVQEFLEREDIEDSLNLFLERGSFDILILIGIELKGDTKRDLAIFSHRKSHLEEVSLHLSNADDGFLGLEKTENLLKGCLSFSQANNSASRKVILPMAREWVLSKR